MVEWLGLSHPTEMGRKQQGFKKYPQRIETLACLEHWQGRQRNG
jgi:hypothetical protein